mmetsp:Transcript_7737/g.24346  ORF Transcript_7737/g.24346 Transcript_7737/m.24346 type:complete len:100 (-) Transcript_7737:40-339(-)
MASRKRDLALAHGSQPNPHCSESKHSRGTAQHALNSKPHACAAAVMVSGMIERLVAIERGDNSTESQFYLDLERRTNFYLSLATTIALLAVIACCGRRV